ncbi:hypothetical protein D3C75_1054100 [compost metagenome]
MPGQGARYLFTPASVTLLKARHYQGILGGEMAVERHFGNTRHRGNGRYPRHVYTLRQKQLQRGINQTLTGIVQFKALRQRDGADYTDR